MRQGPPKLFLREYFIVIVIGLLMLCSMVSSWVTSHRSREALHKIEAHQQASLNTS